MSEKPFHANDPEQVKEKSDKAKRRRDYQEDDLRALLAMPEFRRFAWRLMHETCKLLSSPLSSNGSLQSHDIGMQDVARAVWLEIESIDANLIPQMMIEYRESLK